MVTYKKNIMVRWSHRCSWKTIAQVFQGFSPYICLMVGNRERIWLWEDLWWGDQPLSSQFASLYRVISVRNITVFGVLGNSYLSSWNLNFRRNLINLEIELLERFVSSLNLVHLSFSTTNLRIWSLSSIGSFSVKKNFMVLSFSLIQFRSFWLILFGNQKSHQRSRPLRGW